MFPDADPLTFRFSAGFYADRSHVWLMRLAEDSPPASIEVDGRLINNPDAIWRYDIMPDADGGAFTWLDDRWDTFYWTDKRRIYAMDRKNGLVPLPGVSASQFKLFGQCFGLHGDQVFFSARGPCRSLSRRCGPTIVSFGTISGSSTETCSCRFSQTASRCWRLGPYVDRANPSIASGTAARPR